jgi:hypothetical protein
MWTDYSSSMRYVLWSGAFRDYNWITDRDFMVTDVLERLEEEIRRRKTGRSNVSDLPLPSYFF